MQIERRGAARKVDISVPFTVGWCPPELSKTEPGHPGFFPGKIFGQIIRVATMDDNQIAFLFLKKKDVGRCPSSIPHQLFLSFPLPHPPFPREKNESPSSPWVSGTGIKEEEERGLGRD